MGFFVSTQMLVVLIVLLAFTAFLRKLTNKRKCNSESLTKVYNLKMREEEWRL